MVQTSAVCLLPLFHRLERRFDVLAARRGLELRLVPSRSRVWSDAALLTQILDHVVANAVAYTDRGRVLVGCRRHGGVLSIEIWDTGPGLPLPYRRLLRGGGGVAGDEACGLAVVERLAELLSHPLRVEIHPGQGTRVAVEAPWAGTAPSPGLPPGPRRPLVVVIDDEEDVLEGLRLLLESWRFVVVAAASGDDAVNQLRRRGNERPDGIIADYRLRGGQTGAEAVWRLRSLFDANIPCIIMTGDMTLGRLAQASTPGLTVLQKPVAAAHLRHILVNRLQEEAGAAEPRDGWNQGVAGASQGKTSQIS